MHRRPQEVFGQRKGIHPPSRRTEPRAPRATLGKGREALHLRRPEGQGNTRRSLRRAQPVDRLSLHARPWMDRRLPRLLVRRRQLQRNSHTSRASRHYVAGRFALCNSCPKSRPTRSEWAGVSSGFLLPGAITTTTTFLSKEDVARGEGIYNYAVKKPISEEQPGASVFSRIRPAKSFTPTPLTAAVWTC